ncbi:phosphatidate cytidylyltransferase [Candidatus Marinarcus aquaticus]|uniref:Phosphatidate cytidylyltransferase n=1 Tax=Candidatus Marinarcus aquaticus TaxID=2044504 RepID=A0A4Q0XQ52_9BACT|nr:phosphatidate cytidylyltransferase [Candidatus Marinarcus aquaticus]RXJ57859.1 phosphatidate cytidylyltransferase [Candidatus Marinarcus aquaticus]
MSGIISSSATRIKTGVVLLIAIIAIGYIDLYWVMWLFFGALLAGAIHEAMKLFDMKSTFVYYSVAVLWMVAYFYPTPEDLIFVVGVVYASILAYTKNLDKKLFLVLMYPTASFLFLFALYTEFGMQALLWLLVVVAGADVGAYFVGKSIGKTKFCETSPNKTIEGVVGGVLVATILGYFFAFSELSFLAALGVSIFVAIASVFGDLFESYLKREADVKDSGNLLPGHGGILDRTDGYLFGAIIMLVLLRSLL